MSIRIALVILSVTSCVWLAILNKQYGYSATLSGSPELTASALTDPLGQGKTYRFVGDVTARYKTKHGLVIIKLANARSNIHVEVPVFPSLGNLVEMPHIGDTIEVIGNLSQYQRRRQLRPLAVEYIKIQSIPENLKPQPLANAVSSMGDTLWIGPLSVVSAELFESKRKRRHLRLTFEAQGIQVKGIMFEGIWNDKDLAILRSGDPVFVYSRVSNFRGEASLVTRRVTTLQGNF